MTAVRTALVIGGGIAGPVTAVALRRAGIDATVYEAYPTTADGVGATLSVAPNGLTALRIIDAEDLVRGVGQPMTRTVMTDGQGGRIGEFQGLPDLPPSLGLWRHELCRVLHDHAVANGVPVEYGKRLIDVEEGASQITALFDDGSSASADIIIGADGIRSRVRKLIDPSAPDPDQAPLLNFGGLADMVVPGADPEAMYFVFGAKGFLGYWVQPDGRTAWFGNLPQAKPMTFAEMREVSPEAWLQQLFRVYSEDTPGRQLVESTKPEELRPLGSIESMPKVARWYRDRMVLVGDAVHAPSSSSGQGASMAIESAIQLARCLRDLPDPTSAFAAYEALRRERVEKVIDRGAKTNNSKTLGAFARTMMKIMMPLMIKTFLTPERTLGPEQRYSIDWDAPVTDEVPQVAARA